MNSEIPLCGSFAVDTRDGRIGVVMDTMDGVVQLRPPQGGREWDVPYDVVRTASRDERIKGRVAELNWQSRRLQ
ncbi:hypothetical protein [Streptomyces boncukensis]|uniref:Uncharacterized protein n=1 Tax=Streptomyces boncukensis TaxID=2711219 RepID=A0A6G4WZQ5_9ACTN|nr:hypothetical protein [Streptomyces boncukensis]NGO69994.1 hypothetical protein [Streptomyces boncukensis]